MRVTVRGGRIRGIAPQVLTAEIQNQSVKAMGKGNLVLCRELVRPFGVKSIEGHMALLKSLLFHRGQSY